MKKYISLLMMSALALNLLTGCGAADSQSDVDSMESSNTGQIESETSDIQTQIISSLAEAMDDTAGVLAASDLSEYENREVIVLYEDGTTELLSYDSDDVLSEALSELEQNPSVILVQPNYSYENTALSVSDELVSQQWALYNDGSFYMEDQKNKFPVFDNPFGAPAGPGQWIHPQRSTTPQTSGGGARTTSYRQTSSQTAAAVPGIDINLTEALETYSGGSRDVIVAMVDTGIDYTHEDLAGNIWINDGEIADNGVDDDRNGYIDDVYGWNFYGNNNRVYVGDEDSHGTHGAGTIVAAADNETGIAGVVQSDHVKVMSVKALGGSDGSGSTLSIIRAIQYAEANGASICNLSLGTTRDDRALYQTIAASDMLFIVASGNDGADSERTPCYPASYNLDNIISVANLNYDGTLHSSSNYGKNSVDLAAPGTYILSATPNNSYSYMTGTSMSAPMVSAAAAMVYSHFETITLADVKEILLSSASLLDSLSGIVQTGGMLDIGAAVNYDLSALTGETWSDFVSEDTANTGGSAPTITADLVTQREISYLVLQILDADNDLVGAAYASGTLSAEQFQGGTVGKPVSLDDSGTATYVASQGIFTFYAVDSTGNETVKTISITGDASNTPNRFTNRQPWGRGK